MKYLSSVDRKHPGDAVCFDLEAVTSGEVCSIRPCSVECSDIHTISNQHFTVLSSFPITKSELYSLIERLFDCRRTAERKPVRTVPEHAVRMYAGTELVGVICIKWVNGTMLYLMNDYFSVFCFDPDLEDAVATRTMFGHRLG